MKRYFISGEEITESQAEEIERENKEILQSGSIEELLRIKIIVVIG